MHSVVRAVWLQQTVIKMTIATRDECRGVLERIIRFYNTERPHMASVCRLPKASISRRVFSDDVGKTAMLWGKIEK